MPVAAPQTGKIDVALTTYSKGFRQNGLISDLICPRVLVGKQSDKYWIFGRENQQLTQKVLRATGAPAQRTRLSRSLDSYFTPSHALAADISDEDRANYEIGDLEQDAVSDMMEKILLAKEVEAAALLTSTANLTNNTTLAGGDQWDDYGASKPLVVIEDAKSKIRESGMEANTIVIPEPVYKKLVNHPAIVDRFKYVVSGAIGVNELKQVFDVENLLIARAVQLSAADVSSFVWGKDVIVAYVSSTPGQRDLSLAKTFIWANAPGTIGGFGVVTGRHPDPTAKSDIVGVDMYHQQKVTALEAGYLIKAAVS
jgi:hypothetical protein